MRRVGFRVKNESRCLGSRTQSSPVHFLDLAWSLTRHQCAGACTIMWLDDARTNNERSVPLCLLLEHVVEPFVPIEHVDARTPEFGTVAQCAMLHLRPRARRLAAFGYIVCRVKFGGWRLCVCRKPRISGWRLHTCTRSRASVQHGSLLL